jgi:hypothetical protein
MLMVLAVMFIFTASAVFATENLSGGAKAAAGFCAGFVDELEPLYPDSRLEEVALPEPLILDAARGTIAGVHVLVEDLPKDILLGVKPDRLDFWPAKAMHFFRLIDVPVEVNTGLNSRTEKYDGKRNPYVIRRAPFRIFEVLEPVASEIRIDTPTVALSVQIDVPSDVKPGDYEVGIVINAGAGSISKQFILRVHAATVPPIEKVTFCYTNWYSIDNMMRATHAVKESEQYWEIFDRYIAMMAKGRQNMFRLWIGQTRNAEGRITLDRKGMKKMIAAFGRHSIIHIEGSHLLGSRGDHLITRPGGHPVQSPEGTAEFVEILQRLNEFITEENLRDRWFQHIKDEPGGNLTADYKFAADLIHKHLPGVPVLEATVTRELAGAVDVWCPTVDQYQKHRDFFDKRLEQGNRCWVYTCLTPTGPWVNRLIDMERLRQVYVGWGAARFGTTGFLHWALNRYKTDPFKQSVVDHIPNTTNQLPAGDTHIVYPGPGLPWSSTRFEAHRIGLEDRELLRQLKDRDPAHCRMLIDSVFRGYDNYETEVSAYRFARRRLLEALDSGH